MIGTQSPLSAKVQPYCFVVVLCLLMSINSLSRETADQAAYLKQYREMWVDAGPNERAAIVETVRNAIVNGYVQGDRAEEQLKLWASCCERWTVSAIPPPADFNQPVFNRWYQRMAASEPAGVHDSLFSINDHERWFSSSRLPGYGGIDIYVSTYQFFPFVPVWKWLDPTNAGLGLNTPADEVITGITNEGVQFVRVSGEKQEWFLARPLPMTQQVSVLSNATTHLSITMQARGCDGEVRGYVGFDNSTVYQVPEEVTHFRFRCGTEPIVRSFSRCTIQSAELQLRDFELSTKPAVHSTATLTMIMECDTFGFSVYEDDSSAERAMLYVADNCLQHAQHVNLVQYPGHLEPVFNSVRRELIEAGITVTNTTSNEKRSLVIVQ